MKRSIQWHEHCLANLEAYTQRHEDELQRTIDRLTNDIARYKFENKKRREQIEAAKLAGLEEFDDDRFNIKRKKQQS